MPVLFVFLNGDGLTDLATANYDSHNVSMLLGNGDGTFAAQQSFAAGDRPESVTTGDFNGDGLTDLATANRYSDDVSVLLGNGDSTFAAQESFAAGEGPFSVTAIDFNGDGLTDLATANRYSDDVSVLLGNGDGTFAAQQTFAAGNGPISVTTGDFNGDGLTDLAMANRYSDDVSVLLGNGDGTFAAQQTFAAGDAPESVTAGDFNGDGLTDLATANRYSDDVSVLLGNGDGTFAAQQTFAAGDAPESVTTGDFNGDGLTDLATANFGDSLSVLLNQCGGGGVVEVAPDSYLVTRGEYVSGGVPELAESDNADLSLRRLNSDIQSRTEFSVKAVSPSASLTTMEVTLESAVFARSEVTQTIELYDYVAGVWEQIDTRAAARFTDSTVTVAATGDLSRFVEAGTMCLQARIRYQSPVARQRFASNTDQFIWTIGE